jgi:hypothetical protein
MFFKNRLNVKLMILIIIFSLILFFGYFTLFIGKIFNSLGYNGSIFFYFLSLILIFTFILFYRKNEISFALFDYKTISDEDAYINYIIKFFRLITGKNKSRDILNLLKCYIETFEDNCTDINCSLKIYLEKLNNGIDCPYLLFDHLDKLFKFGIFKFKDNAMLKNDYAMFLAVYMNNKNQANIVLNSIKDEYFSFHRNYTIFRCKNLINKWTHSGNTFYYNHRNKTNEFKQLIYKAINLYSNFWTLLYENKYNQQNNINDLYKFGINIIQSNLKIDELYNLLIKTKTNNSNIFKLYSTFIQDILKDEEKYQKYQNSKSSIYSESFENEVKKYSNFNMDILKLNENKAFLLISARSNDLGIILDCSIRLSTIFGYTKEELIGKNVNILIPDLFHSKHSDILRNKSKVFNIDLYDQQFQKKEYNPSFIKAVFHGVLKSKFITSIKGKIYYIKTEDNLDAFVVEIKKDIPYMNDFVNNKGKNDNIETRCSILTNKDLLIHEFTPNSIQQLGLNYRYIKSNNSIIPYIKQLNDDYKSMINQISVNKNNSCTNYNTELMQLQDSSISEVKIDEENKLSYEVKRKIKEDLINKKYNKKCQITWRINIKSIKTVIDDVYNANESSKCTRISFRDSNYAINPNKNEENKLEAEFIMEIKKAIIDKELIGYFFYFTKIYPSNKTNFTSYNISEKKHYDEKGNLKQSTKYRTIFKDSTKNVDKMKSKNISHSFIYRNKINNNNNNEYSDSSFAERSQLKKSLINKNSNIMDLINNDKLINNKKEETIIDENFIPECKMNFSFDLETKSYSIENGYNNSKEEEIHKKAINKINEIKNYLKKKEKETTLSNSEKEETYTSNSNEDEESSDLEEEPISNSSLSKSINPANTHKIDKESIKQPMILTSLKEEEIKALKESHSLQAIKQKKEEKEENEMETLKDVKRLKILTDRNRR